MNKSGSGACPRCSIQLTAGQAPLPDLFYLQSLISRSALLERDHVVVGFVDLIEQPLDL